MPHARYRYLRALALGLAIARRQHEARQRQARRTIERKPISHDQSYVRINGVWFSGDYVADEVAKRPADWDECAPQKYEEGLRYFDGKRWMQLAGKRKCSQQELQRAGLRNANPAR